MASFDEGGVRSTKYEGRAWAELDHEMAVRESGKSYRPARKYDRPQLCERPACQPKRSRSPRRDERQGDLFE